MHALLLEIPDSKENLLPLKYLLEDIKYPKNGESITNFLKFLRFQSG